MEPAHITGLVLILVVLFLAGYDLWAYLRWGPAGTISGILYRLSLAWPLFPYIVAFTLGCLFGHFFLF